MEKVNYAGRLLVALTLSVINVCATAQTYQSPTVAQSVYPPANSNLTGSTTHMSAYSYGDLYIDGTQRDLYVYTWDRGEAGGGGGFAVREFPTGTPVDMHWLSLRMRTVIPLDSPQAMLQALTLLF
jgi:hypothetical protein